MRIVFIGCVQFSESALRMLLNQQGKNGIDVVGVVTRSISPFNSDFMSLAPLAEKNNVECLALDKNDPEKIRDWVMKLNPDIIFCWGWSFLLPPEILKIPALGVIGSHPAELPRNRGRHPIVWAIVLGLEETASTFFYMDEGADSGDILSQVKVSISPDDDAASLYSKLTRTALRQAQEFLPALVAGTAKRIPQDHTKASYWRKRSAIDGQIDWRMSARAIHNLVRALTRPYVGAHFRSGEQEYKVWKTKVASLGAQNIEPGKVLAVKGSQITVKCGDQAIELIEHDLKNLPKEGDYL